MKRKIPVKIYPGRVHLDGCPVNLCDLEATVKELYIGLEFTLEFICRYAAPYDIAEVNHILGL